MTQHFSDIAVCGATWYVELSARHTVWIRNIPMSTFAIPLFFFAWLWSLRCSNRQFWAEGGREKAEIVLLKSTLKGRSIFFPALLRQSIPRVLQTIVKKKKKLIYFSNIASKQCLIISGSRAAKVNWVFPHRSEDNISLLPWHYRSHSFNPFIQYVTASCSRKFKEFHL